MPYNTKAIKVDVNSKPVPQYFNPTLDDYEALYGANGAMRTLLYDANGNPLLTEPNPGYVRAGDGMIAALGALADAAQTDPTVAASVIALLKGLLTKLADPATAARQDAAKAVLDALNAKDYSTETTLANLLDALVAIRDTNGIKKIADAIDVSDRATRALGVISAADGGIASIGAKADAAVTDPTLSASEIALLKGLLKQLQGGGTGSLPVSLNGSFAAIKSAPVVGAKTVSTTAAELFAGASRLANRYAMVVYNEASIPVYWGPSGVTTANGFALLPQDSVVFQFSPSVATAIYAVASSNAAVRVVELA